MKSIYLTRRKPGFTRDQFVIRWRRHGALAMSTSFWHHMAGYVHAEPIQPAPIAGATHDYDAIAYIIARSGSHPAPEPQEATDLQMMFRDELETFSGPIPPCIFTVQEQVLKPGGLGGVTAVLFFNDPSKAKPVAEHYAGADRAERVILNVVRDDIAAMPGVMPIHSYKAVVEVASHDLARLKTVIEPGDQAPWRAADLAVITRDCVMWDRMP